MYWQDDDTSAKKASHKVIDIVCKLDCRRVPVDHAYALSVAVCEHLPWLVDEPGAGIHPINIPEEGNGWFRPEGQDEMLNLSKRTKLILRIPLSRFDDATTLIRKSLLVAGHEMTVLKMSERLLQPMQTLFSRYNIVADGMDETAFMQDIMQSLKSMDIVARKMLPGRVHILRTETGTLKTQTLMIADLRKEESLKLQELGIGQHQHMGCGLFIPQKSISEVHEIHE